MRVQCWLYLTSSNWVIATSPTSRVLSTGSTRKPASRAGARRSSVEGFRWDPPFRGTGNRIAATTFGRHYDLADTTAVFAANDQMALGLIHGLAERGLSVPGDISVVGFDDVPDAAHFLPPLTTVRQDFAALGALAVRSIIAAINDEDWALHDMIEPVLVVRESTGTARSHVDDHGAADRSLASDLAESWRTSGQSGTWPARSHRATTSRFCDRLEGLSAPVPSESVSDCWLTLRLRYTRYSVSRSVNC